MEFILEGIRNSLRALEKDFLKTFKYKHIVSRAEEEAIIFGGQIPSEERFGETGQEV